MKLSEPAVSINPQPSADDGPDLPPASPPPKKKMSSNAMTRRTFCGLFFGMCMSYEKAKRKSNITPTAASEEMRKLGFREWLRSTGRAA